MPQGFQFMGSRAIVIDKNALKIYNIRILSRIGVATMTHAQIFDAAFQYASSHTPQFVELGWFPLVEVVEPKSSVDWRLQRDLTRIRDSRVEVGFCRNLSCDMGIAFRLRKDEGYPVEVPSESDFRTLVAVLRC